jgi:Fe2+ or Zn2+ uptake regulation protein
MIHEPCNDLKCVECCEHNEHDHFVCLDCGKELDPGEFIDAAEYDMER